MSQQLDRLRSLSFSHLGDFVLMAKEDFLTSERWMAGQSIEKITLPSSNVLKIYIYRWFVGLSETFRYRTKV